MKASTSRFVTSAVAATLVAGITVGVARAQPAGDPVADARAAVLRILGDRASPLGFDSLVQRPFAVCGSVQVRDSAGQLGRRPFVYSLVGQQAYVLDTANPLATPAAIELIRLYCNSVTS